MNNLTPEEQEMQESLDEQDPEWISKNKEKPVLPEAPASIHIDSYIDGFHVGWTKRLTDNNLSVQVTGTKSFVKTLIEYDFKPSWNEETNAKATNGKTESLRLQTDVGKTRMCSQHEVLMKQQVSKTTGKLYFSHSRQTEDGEWQRCFGSGYQ